MRGTAHEHPVIDFVGKIPFIHEVHYVGMVALVENSHLSPDGVAVV